MRYKSSRHKKNNKANRGIALLSVFICVGLCYLLVTSSAGKWLFSNIKIVNSNTDKTEQTDNNSNTEQKALSVSGFTVYTMQLHAFSSEENATKEADSLKQRGGAGYVLKDEVYRVLAFGYDKEEDANNVKNQLKSTEDIDATIYTVSVPKIDFKITADEKNYENIDNAFKTYLSAKDKLHDIVMRLDKKEIEVEQAKKELDAINTELQESYKKIESLNNSDDLLNNFKTVYKNSIDALSNIKEMDLTLFSANVKNLYMQMVIDYSKYVKSLVE